MEKQTIESDPNPFPRIDIFKSLTHLKAVGAFVGDLLLHRHIPSAEPAHGAVRVLDEALDTETAEARYEQRSLYKS